VNPPITIDEVLKEANFRRINSGLWESPSKQWRVMASGKNVTVDWKVFELQGTRWTGVQAGSGPDELTKFLKTIES
jgi:hypothetical protein